MNKNKSLNIGRIRKELQDGKKILALRKVEIMSSLKDGPKIFKKIEEEVRMQTGTLHGHLMALLRLSIVEREKRDGVYEYRLTEVGINWLAIINHTDLIVKAKSKKS